MKKFEKQHEALADLRIKIQESIHNSNITFTYDCETVHEILRNLAAQFAPTDEIRQQEIELEWQALQTCWTKNIEIDEWLHRWEVTYNRMARIKSSGIYGLKPVYKFLNSVNTVDSQFATTWTLKLSMGEKITFLELVIIFRNYRRNASNLLKSQPQHGVFPTLQGVSENGHPDSVSEKPQSNLGETLKSKLKCPCGSKHNNGRTMKYCPYLITKVAEYWKQELSRDRVHNFEKRLSNDKDFRKLVKSWRKTYQTPKERNNSNSNEPSVSERPQTPPIVAMASVGKSTAFNSLLSTFQVSDTSTKSSYELQNSWILDSGATIHVCNDRSNFLNSIP